MNEQAFFGKKELKSKLISKLSSKRFIKNMEIDASRLISEDIFSKGHTLTSEVLETGFDDVISIYKNEFNIPTSFSTLIETIYQGLESNTFESFVFPEKVYSLIKPKQNLNNIWCDFGILLLTDKKMGLRRMAENITLLEIVEEAEAIYKKYRNLPQENFYKNKIDFEELSHEYLKVCKKIEEQPMTETSMMLYALMQALIDDSYIYDALYGIYKSDKLKEEHYIYYSKKIMELVNEEKIA